jgi:hypothetical protein
MCKVLVIAVGQLNSHISRMVLHKNMSSQADEETHRLIERNGLPILSNFSHCVIRTHKVQINCIFITPRLELFEGMT